MKYFLRYRRQCDQKTVQFNFKQFLNCRSKNWGMKWFGKVCLGQHFLADSELVQNSSKFSKKPDDFEKFSDIILKLNKKEQNNKKNILSLILTIFITFLISAVYLLDIFHLKANIRGCNYVDKRMHYVTRISRAYEIYRKKLIANSCKEGEHCLNHTFQKYYSVNLNENIETFLSSVLKICIFCKSDKSSF